MSRIPAKIGKYQIEGKIAEGGMGSVFKGTHPTLDKPVVLKKLILNSNDHLIERFRREAKIMMEFSNENIVRVYDHFKNASAYYIVQELVDGKSIDIILKKERYLRYDEALYIMYYACKALDYAHKNQVVHRDIKPANILLSKTGEIKLVDFGIAQSEEEEESLTKEGMALGTPSYMAPEQYDDSRTVTFKADIYSLGIMLYEMLTGKKPFQGKMTPETLMKIQKGKYIAPRKINPTLPSSLNWYMKKCIQAKPRKRADSIEQILKQLEKWYQNADIERIKQDLICLVHGKERASSTKLVRKKPSKTKFILISTILLILGGTGFALYTMGYQYRTIKAGDYGGFKISFKIDKPVYSRENYHMTSSIFKDENATISNDKVMTFSYKIKEVLEDESYKAESENIFLPPGSYWLKTTVQDKVFWQNIYLPPMAGKMQFKPAALTTVILDWPGAEKKDLRIEYTAKSRTTGLDLKKKAKLSVELDSVYVDINSLDQPLQSGEAYNFKIEADGYYPFIYDLGIKTHQDLLILDAEMIPVEGFLRLESSESLEDSLHMTINGNTKILPGGLGNEMIETSRFLKLKSIPLAPTEYYVEFKSGRISKELNIRIKSDEESVIVIEVVKEKNKIVDLKIKEKK